DVAVEPELVETRALDEEGAAFREERLEGAEVEHGRIRLDLTEVGLYGGVDRYVRREAELEVRAGGELLVALEPVRHGARSVFGHHVRGHFDAPIASDTVQSLEAA